MPNSDASPQQATSRLTLEYLYPFDSLALVSSDDMFLHIIPKRSNTPLKGEAPRRGDWETPMQIYGWRWSQGYDTCRPGQALNANDMRVTDLSVIKLVDSTSPAIAKLCAQAELLALAHLKCFKSGGPADGVQIEFLSMKLEDAYIRNYHVYTSPRLLRACEMFEVSARTLTMTCAPQTVTGNRGAEVTFTLDVAARRVT